MLPLSISTDPWPGKAADRVRLLAADQKSSTMGVLGGVRDQACAKADLGKIKAALA
jgi:hypothetical protein